MDNFTAELLDLMSEDRQGIRSDNTGNWKSQNERYQVNAAIIDRKSKDFNEEDGPVTSILMSREVEVGSRVKSIAEVSAYIIEGKSPLVTSKLNGTHQLLANADDVNILGGSIHTLKENAEALVVATREIGLQVSADKTKYMVMSRDQNAGRIQSVRIDNSTFERVEGF